jgi:hypothetical protein
MSDITTIASVLVVCGTVSGVILFAGFTFLSTVGIICYSIHRSKQAAINARQTKYITDFQNKMTVIENIRAIVRMICMSITFIPMITQFIDMCVQMYDQYQYDKRSAKIDIDAKMFAEKTIPFPIMKEDIKNDGMFKKNNIPVDMNTIFADIMAIDKELDAKIGGKKNICVKKVDKPDNVKKVDKNCDIKIIAPDDVEAIKILESLVAASDKKNDIVEPASVDVKKSIVVDDSVADDVVMVKKDD